MIAPEGSVTVPDIWAFATACAPILAVKMTNRHMAIEINHRDEVFVFVTYDLPLIRDRYRY